MTSGRALDRRYVRAAGNICRAYAGADLELTPVAPLLPDDWGRHRVWRCRVRGAPAGFPGTVVVKVAKEESGGIFDEWAGLQFLNGLAALRSLVPVLYGGDAGLALLVLEDLGDVRGRHDLGAVLEGDDPAPARAALLAHARQMARLHVATAAHEAAFNRIRARLPGARRPVAKDQFERHQAWFRRLLVARGLADPAAVEPELQAILARLRDPGAPRAYTRGDVCPSNVAVRRGRMRFYDFEMGAFRPVFLSAAYFRLSHLSCFNGSLIPPALQAEAEAAYIDGLRPWLPDAADRQADYAAAVVALLLWMLRANLEKRERPRHLATRRQRLFAALTLYTGHAPFTAPFPHTAAALAGLRAQLALAWTAAEKEMALFPAFAR